VSRPKLTEQQAKILAELYAAKLSIISGRVKQYSIGNRSLTYLDLKYIDEQIALLEGASTPRIRRVRVTGL
jgi:hypothetical protein